MFISSGINAEVHRPVIPTNRTLISHRAYIEYRLHFAPVITGRKVKQYETMNVNSEGIVAALSYLILFNLYSDALVGSIDQPNLIKAVFTLITADDT